MTCKLYSTAGISSMGVWVLLGEISAPYELIPTTTGRRQALPAKQLKLNQKGWVPVLLWDQNAMYRYAAITNFLCYRHTEANLAPALEALERSLFLQTLVYFSSLFQAAFQLDYHAHGFADTLADKPSAQRGCQRRIRETWQIIDGQIGSNQWLLGDKFSATDIYLFMLTTWLETSRGHPAVTEFLNVKRITDSVMLRPSVQLVHSKHVSEKYIEKDLAW